MKNSKINIVGVLLLFLSLTCLFIGISYSIFNYFGAGITNNVIQTGRIVFSYSDANGGGNGIYIEDAIPVSDSQGKVLSGNREYFDFTVSASTTKTNLAYEIVTEKNENSTLDDDWVKVYLTTFEGNQEQETPITANSGNVTTYNQLATTTNSLLTGKTIYYGNVQAGEVAYSKKFRLRMWVKDPNTDNFDYTVLNDKKFSLKVTVAATGTY